CLWSAVSQPRSGKAPLLPANRRDSRAKQSGASPAVRLAALANGGLDTALHKKILPLRSSDVQSIDA
ncbi:MAG: hypothetical protein PHU85_13895, partial [Phycisphaerae bacterium]|nr:hypothetical protein [Phycisphaerae bacterium]